MKNRSKALNREMDTGNINIEFVATLYDEFFKRKDYEWWVGVQKGDVVVDLGSCLGMFSAYALDNGASKVYMVEANRELLKIAIKNVSEYMMNEPVTKVYPINCLIGTPNNAQNNAKGIFKSGSTIRLNEKEIETALDKIDRMTFEQIIEDYNIQHIDYLKMDIEGAEYEVITEENFDYLLNNLKHIAAELHGLSVNPARFIKFRDTILTKFLDEGSELRCIGGDQRLVQKWIWDDEFIRGLGPEQDGFVLYITNTLRYKYT